MPERPHDGRTHARWWHGGGGLAAALILLFTGVAAYLALWWAPRERADVVSLWSRELGVRVELRRDALARYLQDGLESAATLADYPAGLEALDGRPTPGHLEHLFGDFARAHDALAAVLWDAEARPVAWTPGFVPRAECAAFARSSFESGRGTVGMHRHADAGPVLTFSAPVRRDSGDARGTVTIAVDPRTWLFPFLAQPLAGTTTGEAALVARANGDTILLSPLRDRPDAVLTLRQPLGSLGIGARSALRGNVSVGTYVDFRGTRVLATGRRVPTTDWAIVMRVDEEEVFAQFRRSVRWTVFNVIAFLLAASGLVWGLWQKRDARERRRHDAEIRHGEERYQALFERMLNGFAYCKMLWKDGRPVDFVYLAVNGAFRDLTGLGDVVGRRVTEVIPGIRESNPELLERYGRVAATGKAETFETYIEPLGIWFSISAYGPEPGHFVAVFDNVTEKKRAEHALLETQRQLAESQKMEAIGRLAGGVAHDFNNLLTVIRGYGELLVPALDDNPDEREALSEILHAAERAAALTRQLLAFSRRQTLEMQLLDLGAIASETEKMLKRLIGEDIRLSVERPRDLGMVRADRGQIEQVLMNLAVNARDAMPEGGPLRIAFDERHLDAPVVSRDGPIAKGRYVVLTMADAGSGMSPETLEHCFEPFFTTKETGKGTGLGLPTVFGIVRQSDGHIRVTSAPGAGTTFELFFPVVPGVTDVAPDAVAPGRGGAETVLLAEDESPVRELTARLLSRRGYRVLAAPNGAAALGIAASEKGPIDLLLTDLVMPGMSGAELGRRLAATRPLTRVLYMSGYPTEVLASAGEGAEGPALLRKPFTEAELSRRVREALDAPAPGSTVLLEGIPERPA